MTRQPISTDDFNLNIFHAWDRGWYLLTAGDFAAGSYNAMTVSWGSMGILWNKPFIQVVVRPQRHTYGFIEKYPTFTLSAFDNSYRRALNLLGAKSGRDGDKIAESGLTPIAACQVAAPAFEEAELVIECEKMYYDNLEPGHFLADHIAPHYHQDFHRVYYGEIKAISGIEKYWR
jgi:flavin reductase (DIM6/NTAB) family NADH-FMN oxidoreductase RutF